MRLKASRANTKSSPPLSRSSRLSSSGQTPGSYRRYPGGKDLPDKIKVWRVQNTGKDFGSVCLPLLRLRGFAGC